MLICNKCHGFEVRDCLFHSVELRGEGQCEMCGKITSEILACAKADGLKYWNFVWDHGTTAALAQGNVDLAERCKMYRDMDNSVELSGDESFERTLEEARKVWTWYNNESKH